MKLFTLCDRREGRACDASMGHRTVVGPVLRAAAAAWLYHPGHPWGCHRPRISDRVVFHKLMQVLMFGCSYAQMPTAPAGRDDPRPPRCVDRARSAGGRYRASRPWLRQRGHPRPARPPRPDRPDRRTWSPPSRPAGAGQSSAPTRGPTRSIASNAATNAAGLSSRPSSASPTPSSPYVTSSGSFGAATAGTAA